jgi:hypothetical protein
MKDCADVGEKHSNHVRRVSIAIQSGRFGSPEPSTHCLRPELQRRMT